MKLTEALKLIQQTTARDQPFPVTLACGFTALHLTTFLTAHLQKALPGKKVRIDLGLYGNLIGTIDQPLPPESQALVVVLEWSDLDPRLGYRQTGGWGPADLTDIIATTEQMLLRLESSIQRVRPSAKVAVCLPTLPLPPVFLTPGWQSSEAELRLQQLLSNFAASIARCNNVAITSRARLDESSPPATRFDFKSDIFAGLPYTLSHADQVAAALARLVQPVTPKKGLITDLDDTFWKGLVGEIGPGAVSWDLPSHGQIHGLYQQTLRALAEQGVLIAVASKNDSAIAEEALARPDILLSSGKMFPLEIHWRPKSGSVERILNAWNIGPESVVFVDDSPMELAEVQSAHPAVECILFPKADHAAAPIFLRNLRDRFGKSHIAEEDALRLDSIRRNAEFQTSNGEAFLAEMRAKLTLDFTGAAADPRVLELVNKTNQFNLNGRRFTESDWAHELDNPNSFVVSVAYEDKFGPLGKIAVLRGVRQDAVLHVSVAVMSCRAFARRIEYQCLRILFDRFNVADICFAFETTSKNGPLQEFFTSLLDGKPQTAIRLTRDVFNARCPVLHHTVITI